MRIFLILSLLLTCNLLSAQSVTFNKDIGPLIQSKCANCHKPNESAPFNLLTYEDVAKRASFIANVVKSKYMPPWKADDTYTHFANNRSLSDEQIKKITDWVKSGAPKGDKPDYKIETLENTTFTREPDLTLKVKEAYKVQSDNKERFIVFKIPFELPQEYNVEAVEFFSTNKKLIHHANYAVHAVPDSIDIYKTADLINLTDDDRTKYSQYFPYKKTIEYYGGWIPGTSYEKYPEGFGWIMPKRGVILLTIHYSPSAKEAESISGINLFFTKTPVKRKIKVISLGSGGIGAKDIEPEFHYIPANKISTYKLEIVNPKENESVFYVWPHMHLLGQSFKAYTVFGRNKDTIPLVNIPAWDFRWQEIYRFKKPVLIPIGSKLVIETSYDNTANNPFNPNSPPKIITSEGDMRSDQEMMTLLMLYVPYEDGDENIELDKL
ncbi:MAG: cytochrome c [Ginsengibacter sp.]